MTRPPAQDFLEKLDAATETASSMLIGGATDGLRAARYVLMSALRKGHHRPDQRRGRGRRPTTVRSPWGTHWRWPCCVEHAAGTATTKPPKSRRNSGGRARLTADETAEDAYRTFDILCP